MDSSSLDEDQEDGTMTTYREKFDREYLRAKRRRLRWNLLHYFHHSFVISLAVYVTVVVLTCFDLIELSFVKDFSPNLIKSTAILSIIAYNLVACILLIAFPFFFSGFAFFRVKPVRKFRTDRGLVKKWVRAVRNFDTENPTQAVKGLSVSLRYTMLARTRASYLHLHSVSIQLGTAAVLLTLLTVFFSDPALYARLCDTLNELIMGVRALVGIIFRFSGEQDLELSGQTLFLTLIGANFLVLIAAVMIANRASHMNIALQVVPDIVRRYLYYLKLYEEANKDEYGPEEARTNAMTLTLESGLETGPELFFDEEGNIDFIDEALVENFINFIEDNAETEIPD